MPNLITIGTPLVHIQTNTHFIVLCSCPGTTPLNHTVRYVKEHPSEFRLPTVDDTPTV